MVIFKLVSLVANELPIEFLDPNDPSHSSNPSLNISMDNREDVEIQLTPRSSLACEMQGIRPEELVYLPQENFQQKSLFEEQVVMRYNFAESKRKDKLKQVVDQRAKLLQEKERAKSPLKTPRSARSVATPRSARIDSSQELEILERIKQQQREELETILEYEIRLANMKREQEYKKELIEEKERKRKYDLEIKRLREEAEKERKREKRKIYEENVRQELEEREHKNKEKAVKIVSEEREREEQRRREMIERDIKMKNRAIEREKKISQIAEIQEEKEEQRKSILIEREKARFSLLEKSKKSQSKQQEEKLKKNKERFIQASKSLTELQIRHLKELQEKQKQVDAKRAQLSLERLKALEESKRKGEEKEKIIAKVREQNKKIEEERLQEILKKKEETDRRVREIEAQREKDLEEKKRIEEEREKQRIETLKRAAELEEAKKIDILNKKQSHEEAMRQHREQLKKQFELKQEERRLKDVEKQQNVERLKRIEEFKKKQKMQKLKEAEERIKKEQEARDRIMKEKIKARQAVHIQRRKIHDVMEKIRSSQKVDISAINTILGADVSRIVESISANYPDKTRSISSSPSRSRPSSEFGHRSGSKTPRESIKSPRGHPATLTPRTPRQKSTGNLSTLIQSTTAASAAKEPDLTLILNEYNNLVINQKKSPTSVEHKSPKVDSPTAKVLSPDPLENYLQDDEDTLYEFRQKQNDELLAILREEREKEYQREQILSKLQSEQQRQFLIEKFNMERMDSNSKIMTFAAKQDEQLAAMLHHQTQQQ